jgi:hypothetical protein
MECLLNLSYCPTLTLVSSQCTCALSAYTVVTRIHSHLSHLPSHSTIRCVMHNVSLFFCVCVCVSVCVCAVSASCAKSLCVCGCTCACVCAPAFLCRQLRLSHRRESVVSGRAAQTAMPDPATHGPYWPPSQWLSCLAVSGHLARDARRLSRPVSALRLYRRCAVERYERSRASRTYPCTALQDTRPGHTPLAIRRDAVESSTEGGLLGRLETSGHTA